MAKVQDNFQKSIGFFSHHGIKTGTTRIRCCNAVEHLKHLNINSKVNFIYRSFPKKSHTIIILHRPFMNNHVFYFIKYIKMLNIPIVYDIDDLLFDEIFQKKINKEKSKDYIKIIKECDFVTVSTNFLKNKISIYNSNTFLIKNTISNSFFSGSTKNYISKNIYKDTIVLAYLSGSKSHDADFSVIENTLVSILEKYDFVKLLIVGYLNFNHLIFQKFNNRIEHMAKIEYSDYHNIFKEIDINLVPLELNDFCHAKSELKYIEAGASGIPSVLSHTKTHEEIIINGKNGFLCYNDKDWFRNLSLLIENEKLRNKIGKAARIDVEENYTSKSRANDWNMFLKKIFRENNNIKQTSIIKLSKYKMLLKIYIAYRWVIWSSKKIKNIINRKISILTNAVAFCGFFILETTIN